MLISSSSVSELKNRIESQKKVYCSGLFLSARWFVFSETVDKGLNLIILPDYDSAQYCASDLYSIIEGDRVFFLPASGRGVEKSNYKSSLGVQRTSAIKKISDFKKGGFLIVVTYPEALDELVPSEKVIKKSSFKLKKGDEISHDDIIQNLAGLGFEKVDFVSAPGQYSIRGSIVDVFSFLDNNPYRISFWGNEIEKINVFNCNTQLSISTEDNVEIVSEAVSIEGTENIISILPEDTLVWFDSSDMYKDKSFFPLMSEFKAVYFDKPLLDEGNETVEFDISPQPVFNKNFELLTNEIRSKIEHSYEVYVY